MAREPSVAPPPASVHTSNGTDSQLAVDSSSQPRSTKDAPLIGKLLQGRYRVVDVIGKGGMGMVYDAIHIGLHRRVALKTLRTRYAQNKTAIARFHKEAIVAGRFGHPNIVEIFDFGELEDGTPYLVMERLVGETITERLMRERLVPVVVAIDIALQVLSALVATHAAGILHRDLKPDNLYMVAGDGNRERVKVLDFGIAEQLRDVASLPSDPGLVAGTPAFMAPEQAQGTADLDARADIYSLGMIVYVMLTGQLPFKAQSASALLTEMQHVKILRPRMLRLDVPRSLDAATMRAIALNRDDRFATAKSMLDTLEAVKKDMAAAPGKPHTIEDNEDGKTEPESEKVEYFERNWLVPRSARNS